MGRIAIAGASGLVGTDLCQALRARGHEVVRLVRGKPSSTADRPWEPGAEPHPEELEGCDAVVNLAGHPIASGLWTASRRKLIRESRVQATRHLARCCLQAGVGTIVNASAVGYYGDRGDEVLDERSPCGGGFLADTCVAWEQALRPVRCPEAREVRVRFGTILSARGGALRAMLPVFRLGLGGPLGGGGQWVSWIHVDDAVSILVRCLEDPALSEAVLAVSPGPVRQMEFARTLGEALGRPARIPAPSFAVKALLGALGQELLLWGQRCRPRVLEESGFVWKEPGLRGALDSLVRVSGT